MKRLLALTAVTVLGLSSPAIAQSPSQDTAVAQDAALGYAKREATKGIKFYHAKNTDSAKKCCAAFYSVGKPQVENPNQSLFNYRIRYYTPTPESSIADWTVCKGRLRVYGTDSDWRKLSVVRLGVACVGGSASANVSSKSGPHKLKLSVKPGQIIRTHSVESYKKIGKTFTLVYTSGDVMTYEQVTPCILVWYLHEVVVRLSDCVEGPMRVTVTNTGYRMRNVLILHSNHSWKPTEYGV